MKTERDARINGVINAAANRLAWKAIANPTSSEAATQQLLQFQPRYSGSYSPVVDLLEKVPGGEGRTVAVLKFVPGGTWVSFERPSIPDLILKSDGGAPSVDAEGIAHSQKNPYG